MYRIGSQAHTPKGSQFLGCQIRNADAFGHLDAYRGHSLKTVVELIAILCEFVNETGATLVGLALNNGETRGPLHEKIGFRTIRKTIGVTEWHPVLPKQPANVSSNEAVTQMKSTGEFINGS